MRGGTSGVDCITVVEEVRFTVGGGRGGGGDHLWVGGEILESVQADEWRFEGRAP